MRRSWTLSATGSRRRRPIARNSSTCLTEWCMSLDNSSPAVSESHCPYLCSPADKAQRHDAHAESWWYPNDSHVTFCMRPSYWSEHVRNLHSFHKTPTLLLDLQERLNHLIFTSQIHLKTSNPHSGMSNVREDVICSYIATPCRKARIFVVIYSVVLHFMVFWVIARWGHGPSHHLGGSELQLLCERHVSDWSLGHEWHLSESYAQIESCQRTSVKSQILIAFWAWKWGACCLLEEMKASALQSPSLLASWTAMGRLGMYSAVLSIAFTGVWSWQ